MQDIINDACLNLFVLDYDQCNSNLQWSWWTAYLSVWTGRQHAGLDVLLGEFCFEERELPRLSHVSR